MKDKDTIRHTVGQLRALAECAVNYGVAEREHLRYVVWTGRRVMATDGAVLVVAPVPRPTGSPTIAIGCTTLLRWLRGLGESEVIEIVPADGAAELHLMDMSRVVEVGADEMEDGRRSGVVLRLPPGDFHLDSYPAKMIDTLIPSAMKDGDRLTIPSPEYRKARSHVLAPRNLARLSEVVLSLGSHGNIGAVLIEANETGPAVYGFQTRHGVGAMLIMPMSREV